MQFSEIKCHFILICAHLIYYSFDLFINNVFIGYVAYTQHIQINIYYTWPRSQDTSIIPTTIWWFLFEKLILIIILSRNNKLIKLHEAIKAMVGNVIILTIMDQMICDIRSDNKVKITLRSVVLIWLLNVCDPKTFQKRNSLVFWHQMVLS